jgi:hypothetical protein
MDFHFGEKIEFFCVTGQVVRNVSKAFSAFIFKVEQSKWKIFDLFDDETYFLTLQRKEIPIIDHTVSRKEQLKFKLI